ncbi:UDP-bacillosamine synthetase [Geobacillus sp. WSUCF1]|nr:UDP-bacillosamine synthetase [Geobacillus sp. WSUCF1]
MEVLDERVKARRAIFDRYVQALGDIEGVHFMSELEGTMSNRWLTTLTIDQKALGVTPIGYYQRACGGKY